MYLTKEEKRTLIWFLLLYLGSSFILFAVIAYLFYQNEKDSFYNRIETNLQMRANTLSSKIVYAHMMNRKLSLDKLVQDSKLEIGFYNRNNIPIVSNIRDEIDFSKHIYQDKNRIFLVDKSTFGHLSVESIVIKRDGINIAGV